MRQWTKDELDQLRELRRDYAPGEIALLMNIEVKDVLNMISVQRCIERDDMVKEQVKKQVLRKQIRWSPDMMRKLKQMYEYASKEELENEFNLPFKRIDARARAAGFIRKVKGSNLNDSWTPKEVKILQDNYSNMRPAELLELFPNRSLNGIICKAKKMGLKHLVVKRKAPLWTKSEDEILRRMYSSAAWNDILKALPGRSKDSIRYHATYALGVSREL